MNLIPALALAGATIVAPTAVVAADSEPTFPAGEACSFDLTASGSGGNFTVRHEGGTIISAGTGSALTLTGNGSSLSLASNGAVTRETKNADRSSTYELMGHNVVILFSTDVGGPAAMLVIGRAVVQIGSDGVWQVETDNGQTIDICAALS